MKARSAGRRWPARWHRVAAVAWLAVPGCASGGASPTSDSGFEVTRPGTELPAHLAVEYDEPPRLLNADEVQGVLRAEYANWLAEDERMRQRAGRQPMPWRGRVVILVQITSAGRTTETQLYDGTGRTEVDRAALRAASAARWQPATRGGEAIAVWWLQSFRF